MIQTYRIHQFGHPIQLQVDQLPPPRPASHEILIEVHAVGLNPVDAYIASGTYALQPELPYVPGLDGAGIVLRGGSGIWQPGDRVFFSAPQPVALSDQIVLSENLLGSLPGAFSFAEGACLGVPALTAGYTLRHRAGLQEGETIFIHGGSGAVGLAAADWLRAANQQPDRRPFRIISSAGTPEGLAVLRRRPEIEVVNHRQSDCPLEVLGLTEGRGVDVILEMNAHLNLARDLEILARHGRVMVIGNRGEITINPRRLMAQSSDIRGVSLFQASPEIRLNLMQDISTLLNQGYGRPWIGAEYPASQAAHAFADLLEEKPGKKVILLR